MYEGGGRAGGGGGGGDVRRRSGQETTKLMISNLDFGVTDADVKVGGSGMSGKCTVPELANFGGKQHPMDIIFPLIPSNLTMDFPLSSTTNIIICNN